MASIMQAGQRSFSNTYLNVFVCYATMELYRPLAGK
jgi:hypothetical protein